MPEAPKTKTKSLRDSYPGMKQEDDNRGLPDEESPSKTPSQVDPDSSPEHGLQSKARMKRRRHINTTDESGHEELASSPRRHPRRRKRRLSPYQRKNLTDQESSQQESLDRIGSEELGARKLTGEAMDDSVQEAVTGRDAVKNGERDDKSRKIHLDLDLEAEVGLKAKIQGDVTLGLT